MDAVEPDGHGREIDAETTGSTAAMSALLPGFDPGRSSRDVAHSASRRPAADRRERNPDSRERRWTAREADQDHRRKSLDDREHEITARERRADRREIDAEVAGLAGRQSHLDAEALMMRLGVLALSLQDLDDVDATLRAIVAAAVDTVPGAGQAGLSVVSKRQLSAISVTDEVVSRVDRAQHDTGEGPAMTSLRERRTVRVDDMANDSRWPRFAARAAEAGVGSMLALRLYVRRDELGVLTLYSRAAQAFDDDAEQIGLLFAAHAAVALIGAQHEQHLTTALTTRDAIGQAKGILVERYGLSADQAFVVLTRASQDTNTKLVDVVRVLLQTGDLTGTEPGSDRHDGHY